MYPNHEHMHQFIVPLISKSCSRQQNATPTPIVLKGIGDTIIKAYWDFGGISDNYSPDNYIIP